MVLEAMGMEGASLSERKDGKEGPRIWWPGCSCIISIVPLFNVTLSQFGKQIT